MSGYYGPRLYKKLIPIEYSFSDMRDENDIRRFGGTTRLDTGSFVIYTEKVAMAAISGPFLIVPWYRWLSWSYILTKVAIFLATTSVFVFVFGLVMACLMPKSFMVSSTWKVIFSTLCSLLTLFMDHSDQSRAQAEVAFHKMRDYCEKTLVVRTGPHIIGEVDLETA